MRAGEPLKNVVFELDSVSDEPTKEAWRVGVPMQLGLEDDRFVVLEIWHPNPENFPLQPGDVVLRIDNTEFETLEEGALLLEGPSESQAIIDLERQEEQEEVFAPRIRYIVRD